MISRRIRGLALVAVLVAIALVATGCSSTLNDAATVTYRDADGEQTVHISQDDLLERVEWSVSNPKFREFLSSAGFEPGADDASADSRVTAIWLSSMIRQVAYDAEFDARRLSVSDADKSDARLQAQQGTYGDPALGVFDAFPQELQDELIDEGARQGAVLRSCSSGRLVYHILLRTRAQAEAAYERIRGGEEFETVAREDSLDGSAQTGGMLGCVTPEAYVPEFQEVAETSQPGVVTQPVETQFGFHLILVRDWDPQVTADPAIAQAVGQAAFTQVNERIAGLDVRVDGRFGTWGSQETERGPVYSVTAPAEPQPRDQREPTTTVPLVQPAG